MRALKIGLLALTLLTVGVRTASADHLVGSDVAAGLIVNAGGLQWAYANPCPPGGCPAGNGAFVGALPFGWQIASAADWNASGWASNAAVFGAFAGKCASAYFDDTSEYDHCDFGDTGIFNAPFSPHDGFDETFVVRAAAIPEPASMLLLGTGVAGLVARRRRNKRSA